MVVVSGSWVKNVATYPTPANNDDMVIPTTNNTMSAKAILICRPNSHPFQERTLTLDQPVKVGRSVARARASPTNAIFDCKVLSRHHALLWYDCGKFYLQDTKSSNGTFVNNNRLSNSDPEPHEVCSGDIVQFGVDVVENNRKVTHCCIVATLKLYLADGKEAKASPSITEPSRHGLVPLDELYKLNQIIQEASQREQCLESKLIALQNILEETRRSADESWQAYIGEERLLSRIATLENQLLQLNKNVTDERLREELSKLHEERSQYQVSAKEQLHKLHAERLEAVATAAEQERAKITNEQEAALAKQQLAQAQEELQDIAHKLMLEQKKLDEERMQTEQNERELQAKLDTATQAVSELESKLEEYKSFVKNPIKELLPLEELEKCSFIYADYTKSKEDMLVKSENCENDDSDYNLSNNRHEPGQNHINLTVAPVSDDDQDTDVESDATTNESELSVHFKRDSNNENLFREQLAVDFNSEAEEKDENEKELKYDSELANSEAKNLQEQNGNDEDDGRGTIQKIDSKTLKYQFQSLQNESKREIEQLQQQSIINRSKIAALESALNEERQVNSDKGEECARLKFELDVLQQNWAENCTEIQGLHRKIYSLTEQLQSQSNGSSTITFTGIGEKTDIDESNSIISNDSTNSDQIASLEEELVVLKERFAVVNDEKLLLQKKLLSVKEQYRALCNRSYNTMFFYIAPLVLMVLYLLISQHFS